ncbi:MAG: hypothetical protein J1F36_05325 [Clostridiales bacterium]|nr:hypothetical protein [Clostridiales bacterium]
MGKITGENRKYKKGLSCGILLIFALLSILCITSVAPAYWAAGSYEFARPNGKGITLTAVDLLEQMFPLDDIEKQYLFNHDNFKFTYSDDIPASNIIPNFEDGTLSVSASSYSYTATNGATVTWTPQKAFVGGRELAKNDSVWTTEVAHGDGDIVTIQYTWGTKIAAADINAFLNKTLNAAISAKDKIAAEEARYEQEVAALDKYEDDLRQYERDYAAYEQYLKDYGAWKRAYDEYAAYLEDYAEYQKELEEYNNYDALLKQYLEALSKYQQYKTELEIYEEKLAQYNKDMASPEVKKAMYQLSVLAYMYRPVGDEYRTIGGAILGDSVTQVLGETEALVAAGAERAAVNRANAATVVLRRLITQYNSLQTDEERYMFYISAYDQLRENFNTLLRTLDYFLSFNALRRELSRRGKTEAFEILIAQLYYICNALDNNKIGNYIQEYKFDKTGAAYFDSSYRIGASKRTPAAVVGPDGVLEDNNDALPLESGYPAIPEMPVMPEEVTNPGAMPQRPKLPVEPDRVDNPGNAPTEVVRPTKPTMPKTPQKYVPTEEETTLVDAYNSGKLVERSPLTNDYTITFTSETEKYFRNVRKITVNFYSSESATNPSYTIDETEIGSTIEYPYSAPTKSREGYTCTFAYWVDEDGSYISLNNLQTEKSVLNLYPHFEETPNLYDVTWIVDGKEYSDTCAYDNYPTYDEDSFMPLDQVGDGVRFYRFLGWKRLSDGTIFNGQLPVMTTVAVKYEAVFDISFLITWVVSDTDIVYLPIWGGEMPIFDGIPHRPISEFSRFIFTGWDKEIVPAAKDETYVAQFKTEYLITINNANGSVSSFGSVQRTDDTYVAYCENTSKRAFDLGGLLAVAAEDNCAVRIILSRGSLSMSSLSVYEAVQSGVDRLAIEELYVAEHTYRYYVQFKDDAGNELMPDNCGFTITTMGTFDSKNSYLTAEDREGNETDVRFIITDTILSFAMRAGYVYDLRPRFTVGIMPSENIDISVNLDRAEYGDIIKIKLGSPAVGMYVRSVYVVDADGNDVKLNDDMTFIMPRIGVMVGVVCDYKEYTIIFKADGKILVSKKLKYGEKIVPPADPVKASDNEYQYTFAGWGKEVGYVTGDMEFNAMFTKEPLTVIKTPISKLSKLIRFLRIGVPIIIAIIFLVRFALLVVVLEEQERKRLKAAVAIQTEAALVAQTGGEDNVASSVAANADNSENVVSAAITDSSTDSAIGSGVGNAGADIVETEHVEDNKVENKESKLHTIATKIKNIASSTIIKIKKAICYIAIKIKKLAIWIALKIKRLAVWIAIKVKRSAIWIAIKTKQAVGGIAIKLKTKSHSVDNNSETDQSNNIDESAQPVASEAEKKDTAQDKENKNDEKRGGNNKKKQTNKQTGKSVVADEVTDAAQKTGTDSVAQNSPADEHVEKADSNIEKKENNSNSAEKTTGNNTSNSYSKRVVKVKKKK